METNSTAPEAGPVPDDAKGDSATTGAGQPANGAVGSAPTQNRDTTEFFDWFRRLGVPRRAGWLGGVCAGIGARLGIDPIIVRGIVVVVAVLGAPLLLLYAVAWLWLPDVDGEIHLERMLRGIVDPAIVGIAVMGVIGLISIMQGGWFGWRWWPDWPGFGIGDFDVFTPLRVLWVLTVVTGVVALVIWLVRRAARTSPGGGDAARMASAPAAAAPGTAQFGAAAATVPLTEPVEASPAGSGTDAAAGIVPLAEPVEASPAGSGTDAAASVEPPIPAEAADAAALAEWREQHEAWRRSRDDWKRSQQDAERAAAAQAAAENKARAQELAARADEARRLRRAARPRASAAYVVTVLGLALVSGASASIWGLTAPGLDEFATVIGLAAMTLVLAAGMFIAAVRRRRSGFLAFVATLATLGMLLAAAAPGRTLVPPSYGISMLESQVFVQPVGDAYLVAYEDLRSVPGTPEIELTQGVGDVYLTILDGTQVELDASAAGEVVVTEFDADGTARRTQASPGPDGEYTLGRTSGAPADVRLTVNQSQGGRIMVAIQEGTAR